MRGGGADIIRWSRGAKRRKSLEENAMIIHSTAPMRTDLAGGTLDIYPLYLFTEGGLTLNAAVTIMSEATVETRGDSEIHIHAEDLGEEVSARNADELAVGEKLDLLARIVKFYNPPCGVNVRTRNNVPKGSGLGASSSLLIALSHALNKLLEKPYTVEEIINYGCNIEAQSIRVPAGKQDYYSATYGGISAIWFGVTGARREEVLSAGEVLSELESRLVVSFAGEPRFSGASNWRMFRAYIDGDERCVRNISRIKQSALAMRESLMKGDLDAFGQLLGEEWENRKGLAEGVTNEDIDAMMARAAAAGAVSSKICGAGGGGSMISFCKPGAKTTVSDALRGAGALVFDCSIARRGVRVAEQ
jgi:D-glycero-alpha-D-manno-heptose-7-phosphate kinase